MFKWISLVLLFGGILVLGCSSSTPPEALPDTGAEEIGGDIPLVDLQPATPLPTVLNLTTSGGFGQSDNFRIRFVLSGPVAAGTAASDSFQVQAGSVVADPNQ